MIIEIKVELFNYLTLDQLIFFCRESKLPLVLLLQMLRIYYFSFKIDMNLGNHVPEVKYIVSEPCP